tara:strand:- start:1836 stop:2363 length:528 start_codon:yes stop_codon:yes gene_type:complete
MKSIGSFLTLAFIFVGSPANASECSFREYDTAREHIHNTPVIFEGVALGPLEETRSLLEWAQVQDSTRANRGEARTRTYFRVLRIIKGDVSNPVLVNHIAQIQPTGVCLDFAGYELGATYLVTGFLNEHGDVETRNEDRFDALQHPEEYYEGRESYRGVIGQMVQDSVLTPRRPN